MQRVWALVPTAEVKEITLLLKTLKTAEKEFPVTAGLLDTTLNLYPVPAALEIGIVIGITIFPVALLKIDPTVMGEVKLPVELLIWIV